MAQTAAIMQLAGGGLQLLSTIAHGNQAEAMGQLEQAQQYENALKTEAVSQREAISERKKGTLAKSRAKAIAAASGLSATDEGAKDVYDEIDAQADYNAMAALYSGYDQAKQQRRAGDMAKWEGKQAKKASRIDAAATLLGTGSTMYERYGKK